MKKLLLATISSLSILFSSTIAISPASAFVYPNEMSVVTFTVGDVVSHDMGCQESNITDVHFSSGSLPPGLSMDSQGLITGTPTTPGDYTLNGYSCSYNGGGNGGSWPDYFVTFRINAITTPAPIVAAKSLNVSDCSFYFAYLLPGIPDSGTVFTKIENQTGTSLIIPAGSSQINSGELIDASSNLSSLNEVTSDPNFIGTFTGNPFSCGDTLAFTVGYQYRGAPVATTTISGVVVDKPATVPGPATGSAPIQKLINLNNNNCEFRVLAWLPTTPLPGSTEITINSYHPEGTVDQLTYTIADNVAAGLMDFTFNPTDLSSGPSLPVGVTSQDYRVSTSWACGSILYVSVDYRDLLNNYFSSTWAPELQKDGFGVTPTKPETTNNNNNSGDYTITAAQSNVGTCNISVVATLPDEARPIGIAITSVESTDWISAIIVYEPVSVNGVITANLSFTSKDGIFANVPVADENKLLENAPECSGTFRAIIDSPGGILASTTFTLGQTMPTCNAGSIRDEEHYRCSEVERGFYTTELNSTTPIACPAGMTTATTASKSVNDCYKPLVQSIVGLKAPKALKFKGTTNLALTTNTKALAAFKVVGPCSAKLANVITTVKGKKVTTKMLKVTAGTKAGNCLINLTSPTSGKYLDLKKVVQIKVSKTGK